MRIAVTGCAGFIGSTTVRLLLQRGHEVVGIDALTDYYDPAHKRDNLEHLANLSSPDRFEFHELDLSEDLLGSALIGTEVLVHLAGQPGVRHSWSDFDQYTRANITATKTLLDATLRHDIRRVVYASSSSVYGDMPAGPTNETRPTNPQSPYAVTKLAGEHLCAAYAHAHELDTTALRYFTVYGPRQRPDMLVHRLIDAAHTGRPITIFGDGEQRRDFTYVDDIAAANVRAVESATCGHVVLNVSGGTSASVSDVISAVEVATGRDVPLRHAPSAIGDARHTSGDSTRAAAVLGWKPSVDLDDGITRQVAWQRRSAAAHSR